MGNRNFREMLENRWSCGKFVCVGLDSDINQIPSAHILYSEHMSHTNLTEAQTVFNRQIVEATKNLACAYKPNIAFYESLGGMGMESLWRTVLDIHAIAPDVPVILDAKRADIGNTNAGYVEMAFNFLKVDAITVNPYLGAESLQPFLSQKEKGIFVLCRTSNPGAGEFQDLPVLPTGSFVDLPLYKYVAENVARHWNNNNNCALVVGATCPDELRNVRKIVGDMPILIPGVGAQGGKVEEIIPAGKDSRGRGIIVNSSRGIIYASKKADFAEAAYRKTKELHDEINRCLALKSP